MAAEVLHSSSTGFSFNPRFGLKNALLAVYGCDGIFDHRNHESVSSRAGVYSIQRKIWHISLAVCGLQGTVIVEHDQPHLRSVRFDPLVKLVDKRIPFWRRVCAFRERPRAPGRNRRLGSGYPRSLRHGHHTLYVVAGIEYDGSSTKHPAGIDIIGTRQNMDYLRMLTHNVNLEPLQQLIRVSGQLHPGCPSWNSLRRPDLPMIGPVVGNRVAKKNDCR